MKKLLVTPLGTSPGLLYTVLSRINPDEVIILTSEEGKEKINEVCNLLEFDINKIKTIIIKDPFTGFNEIKNLTDKFKESVSNMDSKDNHYIINYTGGTSFMQYIISKFSDLSEEHGKIRKIFAIDRRPFMKQRENPYIAGEIVDIP